MIGSTQANAFVGNGSICCTLTEAMGKGGGQIPMIATNEPIIYDDYNGKIKSDQSCIGTLTTNIGLLSLRTGTKVITYNGQIFRVRKLTPKECFRLMGFDDADVDLLIANGISNTQLYKMAGNSIVVNVLEFLFCQLFDSENELWV